MAEPYELLPTRNSRDARRPKGWVTFAQGMNTKRRTMTEGYLNQRMPRSNTIGSNQHYVERVLDNPRTPDCNRQAVIDYVHKHPEKFVMIHPVGDEEYDRIAKAKNGRNPNPSFMQTFKRKYGRPSDEW